MALFTPEQLQKVREVIEKHHAALAITFFGKEAKEELKAKFKALADAGLIDPQAVNLIDDPIAYGQLMARLNDPTLASKPPDKVVETMMRNPSPPLTDAERAAIDVAKKHAGQYCTGLGNRVASGVMSLVTGAEADLTPDKMREIIRDKTAANREKRQTAQRLKKELGDSMGNWTRDWLRIATTEANNAVQEGAAQTFEADFGDEVRVSKLVRPDACPDCKNLYLEGGEPKIFTMAELRENGSNVGKRRQDWKATVEAVHPWCGCTLVRVPDGMGWKDGEMVLLKKAFETQHDLVKAGPFIGPRGGKWADPQHTIPWDEKRHGPQRSGVIEVDRRDISNATYKLIQNQEWKVDEHGMINSNKLKSGGWYQFKFGGKQVSVAIQPTKGLKDWEGGLGDRKDGTPAILIRIPAGMTAGLDYFQREIRKVLAHEVTHLLDRGIKPDHKQHVESEEATRRSKDLFAAYANDPPEVRARMQEAYRDAMTPKSQALAKKVNTPGRRKLWVKNLDGIKEMWSHLTPANRKKVLKTAAGWLSNITEGHATPMEKSQKPAKPKEPKEDLTAFPAQEGNPLEAWYQALVFDPQKMDEPTRKRYAARLYQAKLKATRWMQDNPGEALDEPEDIEEDYKEAMAQLEGNTLAKSQGAHKYKSRKRVGDHWEYEYEDDHQHEVAFHPKTFGRETQAQTYHQADIGEGKVRLSREKGGAHGPTMPKESVAHFVNDLAGKVDLPKSGNPKIDAVIDGKADFLGKGDDGMAFKVGDDVVKVSTTVPYQPENPGHRSPDEASDMLKKQVDTANMLADKGIDGIQRSKFVKHGDKGFQIKPYVEIPKRFTQEQLDAIQDTLIEIHKAGYAVNDEIQAGLEDGKPVMFDVGKAAKIPEGQDPTGIYSNVNNDMGNLRQLYQQHGLDFVRRDFSEGQQAMSRAIQRFEKWWAVSPKLAHKHLGEAVEKRVKEINATMEGEKRDEALNDIDGDTFFFRIELEEEGLTLDPVGPDEIKEKAK